MNLSFILIIICLALNIVFLILLIKGRNRLQTISESFHKAKNNISFLSELAHLNVRHNRNKSERVKNFLEAIKSFSDCEVSGLIFIKNSKQPSDIKSGSPENRQIFWERSDVILSTEIEEDIMKELQEKFSIMAEKGCSINPEPSNKIKSLLMVPVYSGNTVIGGLFLLNKIKGVFSQEDEENLIIFSYYATGMIESLELSVRLNELSGSDVLTGLQNHRAFMERLSLEIERAKRFSRELSIIVIDIDNFTKFNETYGYASGDEMLTKISGVIRRGIRTTDLAARYSGESFGVILPETTAEIAMIVAERSRIAINALRLDNPASPSITVSAGISTFPHDARNAMDLVDKALQAVYLAKQKGKNRICSYRDVKQEFLMRG